MRTTTAEPAYADVLARAGASRRRDAVDRRIVADVTNGTGRLIEHRSEVGGHPTLAAGTPPVDSDGDEMPDRFEVSRGANPNVQDANGDENGNG